MSTFEPPINRALTTVERIEQIVRELLGDDDIVLTEDTKPKDIEDWDSLANVTIVFGLEEDFGVRLGDELLSVETIGDLARLIDSARR